MVPRYPGTEWGGGKPGGVWEGVEVVDALVLGAPFDCLDRAQQKPGIDRPWAGEPTAEPAHFMAAKALLALTSAPSVTKSPDRPGGLAVPGAFGLVPGGGSRTKVV